MVELYHRDSMLLFYDVTNYYFEIDNGDSLRRKGVSKQHRKTPIVQMGLFMDDKGFPVTYDLFPGNTNDCITFTPMSETVRAQLEMEHIIFVADKAMMSGDNVAEVKDTYVKNEDGKRTSVTGVGHYQILYWPAKYAMRAKGDRQAAVEKALAASHSKRKDVIDNNHGSNKYLKTQVFDKNTKKQLETYDAKVVFDFNKLDEDESLDGFYVIETNVMGLRPCVDAQGQETGEFEREFGQQSRCLKKEGMLQLNRLVLPLDIVDMYHGLWKIEQTFRVTKSELNARPIYVSREDRISSHFLTCFISLLIVRILEHELNHEYSSEQIIT